MIIHVAMRDHLHARLQNLLKHALVLIAVAYLITYFVIALNRIAYPYELEWMEGGSVDHVRWILAGRQLYNEPSLEFIPFIYAPLYYYVCALLSHVLGVGFFPLRLVSFLSSLGCLIILFEFVRRETRSSVYGILSACLYAATYRISGAWFDIARSDSLFMLFLLASIILLRFHRNTSSLLLSGILMSLSFLTKQTALFIAIPLSIYCLIYLKRWTRFVFPATFLLTAGLSALVLNWVSDGWYFYYAYQLPLRHPPVTYMIINFWRHDLLNPLSIALAISLLYLIHLGSTRRSDDTSFFLLLFIGMVGASWISRLHTGGYSNVLFPAYAAIAIHFALGIRIFASHVPATPGDDHRGARSSVNGYRLSDSRFYQCFVMCLCIFQFLSLSYNPSKQLPSKEDREAGNKLVQIMRNIEGDVFLPYHGYIPALAGKKTYAHYMAMDDILRAADDEIKDNLVDEIRAAIRRKQFSAIILDSPWFTEEIEESYTLSRGIFDNADVFWPVTGMKTRPEMIYQLAE